MVSLTLVLMVAFLTNPLFTQSLIFAVWTPLGKGVIVSYFFKSWICWVFVVCQKFKDTFPDAWSDLGVL